MNEMTRDALVAKLGTLMFANAELGATNEMLVDLVHRQKAEIDALSSAIDAAKQAGHVIDMESDTVASGGARH